MELTDDDVVEILKLFEQSKFDFLQLEQGERRITVSKGGYQPTVASSARAARSSDDPAVAAPISAPPAPRAMPPAPKTSPSAPKAAPSAATPAPSSEPTPAPVPVSAPEPAALAASGSIPEGLVAVTAPMVGKFYSAPAPSDPPYVEVGSKVAAGATVGLIEVMKVFASIKTEIAGVIERILVSNGEFVEFGQPLFLIRPAA